MNLDNIITDKAILLSVISLSISMTNLDILLKILLSFVSLIYVIYKLLNEKKKYDDGKFNGK
jgi:hypothetical protein